MSTNQHNRLISFPDGSFFDPIKKVSLNKDLKEIEKIDSRDFAIKSKRPQSKARLDDSLKIDSVNVEPQERENHIYLLINQEIGALKIGISINIHARIKEHLRRGFHSIDIIKLNSGSSLTFEQFILSFIKANWIPMGDGAFNCPFDGYTECWPEKMFPIYSFDDVFDLIVNVVPTWFPRRMEHFDGVQRFVQT